MKTSSSMRWALFALCLAVFVGALAWITQRAMELERQRAVADADAQVQEKVRLALWRMEAEASAVVVRESARPAHHYQPFHALEDLVVAKDATMPKGGVRMPSPLLGTLPELVKLHFERAAGLTFGGVCSPQTPVGAERELALERYAVSNEVAAASAKLAELELLLAAHPGWENELGFQPVEIAGKLATIATQQGAGLETQQTLNFNEQVWRSNTLVQSNIQQQGFSSKMPQRKGSAVSDAQAQVIQEEIGEMRAIWLGEELLLVRKVRLAGGLRMQGVWLDWPKLEARLLAAAKDLLPAAKLQPIHRLEAREDWMALVTLPVRLVPGALAATAVGVSVKSGLRAALLVAWGCFISAAAAIALVLHRAVQLSERRAAFVSAVTHELRTPLTTFRLYSEMLADEMVPEGESRKAYLKTLCEESTRLMHLVENVLSFSRIEKGRAAVRLETVKIADLIERLTPRLRQRCEEAGLTLVTVIDEAAGKAYGKMDAMAVEQILFNLTDNACKYAAPDAITRELRVNATADSKWIRIEVEDFGPGLPPRQLRMLFQPFSKSATEAAHSAPGVGLGLALSRRLAREVGGDLSYETKLSRGATFCLRLPCAMVKVTS
jgi:signal transduction histidine kinase